MTTLRILIADDERPARFAMKKTLASGGYELLEAAGGREALEAIQRGDADLVFLDLNLPDFDGQLVLRELAQAKRSSPLPEIVIVTANDSIPVAVECLRLGAADFLTKPYEIEQVRAIARRSADRIRLHDRVAALETQLAGQSPGGAILGTSPVIRRLIERLGKIAPLAVDTLLLGETGTGKELVARELHRLGPRAAGPFVAVNTAAIAESLAESELFGHVRGAFTGAANDRTGAFAQAHGGTLFLDEVGDMPLASQAKILRVLQDRMVTPVGSSDARPIDVCVITATHQDLQKLIGEGKFRRDLYYRIAVVTLEIPPLSARRDDIPMLANFFLERFRARREAMAGHAPLSFAADAIEAMVAHTWPGNVRELEHAITAAAALCGSGEIRAVDLPFGIPRSVSGGLDFTRLAGLPLTEAKNLLVDRFERWAIEAALEAHDGNVSAAARQLGIHRQNLQQKMTQLGIARPVRDDGE